MMFLAILSLILITTWISNYICQKIKIPIVIGQLISGIILGPAFLNWLTPSRFINYFAEIGVILLMFEAGLETNLKLLKKYLRPSIMIAILGVIFPIAMVFGLAKTYGISTNESIVWGVIFSVTSVSVSVAVLSELKILNTRSGTTILGAAIIDDIISVISLSLMMSLFKPSKGNNLLLIFGLQIAYLIFIYLIFRFGRSLVTKVPALFTCFALAYLAEVCGLSTVLGAFFAGIILAHRPKISQEVKLIGENIFMPVFFVSIGLSMTLITGGAQLLLLVLLTICAILSKIIGAGLGALINKYSLNEAYLVGCGMVSRGEMALIITQTCYQAKLIGTIHYSVLIATIILTTLISPFLLKSAKISKK